MSSARRATYSEATSRSSSRIASRYAVYCSVIWAIGMSVIETSLTRMRWRSRSSGPLHAAMSTGGRTVGCSVSLIPGTSSHRTEDRAQDDGVEGAHDRPEEPCRQKQDEYQEPEWSDHSEEANGRLSQNRSDDTASVERRDGDQVEDGEPDVHDRELKENVGDGGERPGREALSLEREPQILDRVGRHRSNDRQEKHPDGREQEVGDRACGRYDEVRQAGIRGVPQIDRRGLGGAEDDPSPREEIHHEREQDASERVDVADGVQADPPEIPRGRVAELERRPGVGRFVKRDREQDDGELDPEVDDLERDRIHWRA